MNGSNYPEEIQLEKLKKWDVINDLKGFLEYLEFLWNTDFGDFVLENKELTLITGGWSGNEDIIASIPQMFNMVYWCFSERGGKHVYNLTFKGE